MIRPNLFSKKAFTLVEVLITIAVVSILFIVIASKIDFTTNKSKISGVQSDFRAYQSAFHSVGTEHQGFTNNQEELVKQVNRSLDPKLALYIDNHMIKTDAEDPWGEKYQIMYKYPSESRGALEARSAGPDLLFYTTDDISTVVTYQLTDTGSEIVIKNYGSGNNGNTEQDMSIIASTGGMMDSSETRVLYTWNEMVRLGIIDSSGKVVPGSEDKLSGIIVLPQGMTALPIEAYKGCTKITGIILPESITELPGGTFWGCTNLKEITIPETVTFVGNYTFRDCTSLESVKFPSGVSYINPHVLEGCTGVKNVSIPDGVTILDCSVFKDNKSITSISLPSSVEVIWNFAFSGCTNLTTIHFAGTVEQWNAITFGNEWHAGTPNLSIICSNGTVNV